MHYSIHTFKRLRFVASALHLPAGFPCLHVTVIFHRNLDRVPIACQDSDNRVKSNERIIEKD